MSNKKNKDNVDSPRLFTLSALAKILQEYSQEGRYRSGPAFYRELLNPYYRKLEIYRSEKRKLRTDLFANPETGDTPYDKAYATDLCQLKLGSHITIPFMRIEVIKLIILYYNNYLTGIYHIFKEDFNSTINEILREIREQHYNNITDATLPDDPFGQLVTYMLCAFDCGDRRLKLKLEDLNSPLKSTDPELATLLEKTGITGQQFVEDLLPEVKIQTDTNYNKIGDIPSRYFLCPRALLNALIKLYIHNNFASPQKLQAGFIKIIRHIVDIQDIEMSEKYQQAFHTLCALLCEEAPDYIQRKLKENIFNEKTRTEFYKILEESMTMSTKTIGHEKER